MTFITKEGCIMRRVYLAVCASVLLCGVQLVLPGFMALADDGGYLISGLPFGRLSVVADQVSFQSAPANLTVAPGTLSVGSVDLALNPSAATSVRTAPAAPAAFSLRQNYPNPFNPSTRIAYAVPAVASVSLRIYNVLGQVVATLVNGVVNQGQHETVWNGTDNNGKSVASGIYFYRLDAAPAAGGSAFRSMKKMVFLK
jgi:hypothetical protein